MTVLRQFLSKKSSLGAKKATDKIIFGLQNLKHAFRTASFDAKTPQEFLGEMNVSS
jgi:hypothetical protein